MVFPEDANELHRPQHRNRLVVDAKYRANDCAQYGGVHALEFRSGEVVEGIVVWEGSTFGHGTLNLKQGSS